MATKLFIGGLAYAATEDELRDLFATVGDVASVAIITDRETGRSKGFGFIEMADDDLAKAAIDQLNGKELAGRSISVSEARPQQPRENRSFGGERSYGSNGGRPGGNGGSRGGNDRRY